MSADRVMHSFEDERMERVLSAIALASTGEFALAIAQLEHVGEDPFGVLEEAMRLFLRELGDATQRNAQALAERDASKRDLEDKLRTIEQQQIAIRDLSVPIIDVWEGVLTLPLVGVLDTSRAVDVSDRLLSRVVDSHASWVILDLTGVMVVDTSTAQHLLKLARSVQLLGARCVLTGVGSGLAQTLVTLGVSLDELNPKRTLREGLRYCLTRRAAPAAAEAKPAPPGEK